ncbi:DUF4352 domain-containing protein [Acrocarpospora catenulata]|uniref:DUF4352 domain-containing protein n=1 Tax=Acrocarpospora catenulata TaxID=2836182 RepID=UPI001BD99C43|nr:DUF4352 domain-containing protein [Acrocarpospora catenulata]
MGTTQESSDATAKLKVTVLRVRQPLASLVPGLPERKSYEYAAVEVRTCVVENTSGQEISLSWGPWSLAFPDGTIIEAMSAWSSEWWDVSLYPNSDRSVRTGRCVKGWIPFEVPKGSKPKYVNYDPQSTSSLEWVIR